MPEGDLEFCSDSGPFREVAGQETVLAGRFGYFSIFLLGEGKGESEAPGVGVAGVFIENPRRGGGFSQERGNDRGPGRVSAGNLGGRG